MTRQSTLGMALWCTAVGGLAAIAAAIGVFARGDGSTILVTSVRGGQYEVAANGVYAFNAQRVVAEGVGWDVFTLVVAAPAMLIAAMFVARGSIKSLIVGEGLLAYFLYTYLEYSVTWAFGALFPLFLLIVGLSIIGLICLGAAIAESDVATRFGEHFPRRGWVALSVTMALLLTLMWTGRIWQGINGQADELLLGETTMTVQALDLGLVMPVMLFIAWLTWRRNSAGYLVATVFSVTFVSMAAAITSMLVSAGFVEGTFEWPPIIIFGAAATAAVYLSMRLFQSLEPASHAARMQARPIGATA